jgi:cysteine-rich repeat protein
MQLGLAPFTDVAPNGDGLMAYAVVVARVEHLIGGGFPAGALRGSVLVEPEEDFPSCGDGHVDPGEGCDDGDTEGGDGCSPTCQIEVIP